MMNFQDIIKSKVHTSLLSYNLNIDELAQKVLNGDRMGLSKALTLVESKRKEDVNTSRELIRRVLPHSGKSLRLGITGAPGVGKSTFIENLGAKILNDHSRIAILSVDPTSPTSGGSILGDKTRMENLSRHDQVYVRPSPSGVEGGGISGNTRDQITLCEAAGYEVVILETVGVGQGETAASLMVDYLLLLLQPGGGDELQGIKRGIMEVAHAFAFTKSDMTDQKVIRASVSDIKIALHMLHEEIPEVFTCSGLTGEGIEDIWKSIRHFMATRRKDGSWENNRSQQDQEYFDLLLRKNLVMEFLSDPGARERIVQLKQRIASRELTPDTAVNEIISNYFKGGGL